MQESDHSGLAENSRQRGPMSPRGVSPVSELGYTRTVRAEADAAGSSVSGHAP